MSPTTARELNKLLAYWGIAPERDLFHGEGIALLANLVNYSAKVLSYEWYDYKAELVQEALECTNHSWLNNGIAYIETCVGQVSFHVFPEDEIMDTGRQPKPWSQIETQFYAVELIQEYLRA